MVGHGVRGDVQVGSGEGVAPAFLVHPRDGRELGPLDHLANHRRDLPIEQLDGSGDVGALGQLPPPVEANQPFDGLDIRGSDADDGVQATGAQECLVDVLGVVGGEDHHQLRILGVHAVERVEDRVHLRVPVSADRIVDVLGVDDRRLVLPREEDRLLEMFDIIQVDERPAVRDRLLGQDVGRQGFPDAVGPFEENAPLQRDALLAAFLGAFDWGEHGDVHHRLDFTGEDEPVLVHQAGVEEFGPLIGVELLRVLGEPDPDGLAPIH